MALPSGTYAPRDPAASVLYQVVRDHCHTFRAEASQLRDGEVLPRFVDEEFVGLSTKESRIGSLHKSPPSLASVVSGFCTLDAWPSRMRLHCLKAASTLLRSTKTCSRNFSPRVMDTLWLSA